MMPLTVARRTRIMDAAGYLRLAKKVAAAGIHGRHVGHESAAYRSIIEAIELAEQGMAEVADYYESIEILIPEEN